MKLAISLLSAALALSAAAPLSAQTLTTWDYPVKVTATDGALTKTSGCNGCPDSGARSVAQLSGNGYAEFVVPALGELFAGLGADLSSSTSSSTINYALSLGSGGSWEVRELGVYKGDGVYAAGDRFRVAVENGVVVYRRNGTAVYTSKVAPAYPLVLDVTLYSPNAGLTQASLVAGSTSSDTTATPPPTTPPPTTPPPSTPPPSSAGVYVAVTDRVAYAKPALPVLGPANSKITDPVFRSQITRITDAVTRPGTLDRSYRTPSSPHQNAWSANGTYFYVVSDDGTSIPFAFDPATGTAKRLQPTATGAGGMVLTFYIEPGFSYIDDAVIYGSVAGGNLHTIDQYNFSTGAYTRLLDLETVTGGLSGTYVGGVSSSAGATERIMVMFGGSSQDHHHFALVFDKANPANRVLIDTYANTINGMPTSIPLNFSLHHAAIDRSGRYVMLYPTAADQSGTRKAPQSVAWDTQTGVLTNMPVATLPYGHDAFGYGVSVNQDCCVKTSWDAAQWQFRNLATPTVTRDLLPIILTPKEIYLEDHTTWNNARPDVLLPVISGTFRYGTSGAAWRALDDEIIAIQTDAPGVDPTIWRFAHHRSNIAKDSDATVPSFWYEPRPNVSHDGRWVLFTSNWEKTLGVDPVGEPGTSARQDVFVVQLKTSDTTVTPPPPVVPVAIAAATLPAGVTGSSYAGALTANGGSGTFSWSIATGTLPAGLSLNATTGAIAGTPALVGTFAFTVKAADASNPANSASANEAITVTAPIVPVAITATVLSGGMVGTPYAATLSATGGSSAFAWTVSAGALPTGLALNPSTGAIVGTPSAGGSFDFTVTAVDAANTANAASASFAITIAVPVSIGAVALPNGLVGTAYAAVLSASGGSETFTWSISAGALPPGLTLDSATGAIIGTPSTGGSFAFSVTVADSSNAANAASAAAAIAVSVPVSVATATLPNGTSGTAYSSSLSASGGSGSFTWSISGGTLPAGLALNATTGTISGTPTMAATSAFTVSVADASEAANKCAASYSVTIAAAPTGAIDITSPRTLPNAYLGVAYAYQVTAVNVRGTAKWTLAGGALPPGITLNAATGLLSGVPSKKGTFNFNARITDTVGSDTLTLTIVVK